jgi:hypothetical protein
MNLRIVILLALRRKTTPGVIFLQRKAEQNYAIFCDSILSITVHELNQTIKL